MRQNFVLEDENLYVFNSNYNKVISNCSGMKSHHGIWVLMNHYRTSTNQVFKKKTQLSYPWPKQIACQEQEKTQS